MTVRATIFWIVFMRLSLVHFATMFLAVTTAAKASTNSSSSPRPIPSITSVQRHDVVAVKFEIADGVEHVPERALVYRSQEYSFDMEPPLKGGFTAVLIDDLNLEVDNSGKVISIWGMCPQTRWQAATLAPPVAKAGALFVASEHPLSRGVSVQVHSTKYLPTYVDWKSGWVKVEGQTNPASAVQVFSGVIVEIDGDGQFSSLWLRPRQSVPLVSEG